MVGYAFSECGVSRKNEASEAFTRNQKEGSAPYQLMGIKGMKRRILIVKMMLRNENKSSVWVGAIKDVRYV